MSHFGFWTDPHGLDNANAIKKVFDLEGIVANQRVNLGDNVYGTLTDYSARAARLAMTTRLNLRKKTALREEVMKGHYSDEQLAHLLDPYEAAKSAAEQSARETYGQWQELFPQATWVAGNWDRVQAKEVFGDDLLESGYKEINSINFLGLSGGGSKPMQKTFMGEGLYADDQETKDYKHQGWVQKVVSGIANESIDVLLTHVPPKLRDDSEHVDAAEEHLADMIEEGFSRRERNTNLSDEQKAEPLTVFYGHKHRSSAVEFVEYENGTILSVTPGVSADSHNSGAYSSFITTEFDDVTKRLMQVNEFRIYNYLDGEQKVELYATHKIDWEAKKVKEDKVKRTILTQNRGPISQNLNADKNLALQEQGFKAKYEGISAREKDTRFIMNLALADEYAEKAQTIAKHITAKVRRELLKSANGSKKVGFDDLEKYARQIRQSLAEQAAKDFGITFASLPDDDAHDLYRDILIKSAYGVDLSEFNQVLYDSDLSLEHLENSWASDLGGLLFKSVRQHYQGHAIKGLEANDLQDMIELYMPLNYERTEDASAYQKQELINLWAQAWNNGYLSGKDLADNRLYKEKKDFTANKKTREELEQMLGQPLSEEEPDENQSEEDIRRERMQDMMDLYQNLQRMNVPLTQTERGPGFFVPVPEEMVHRRDTPDNQAYQPGGLAQEQTPQTPFAPTPEYL